MFISDFISHWDQRVSTFSSNSLYTSTRSRSHVHWHILKDKLFLVHVSYIYIHWYCFKLDTDPRRGLWGPVCCGVVGRAGASPLHCASQLKDAPQADRLPGRLCLRSLIFQKCISLHTALTAKTNTFNAGESARGWGKCWEQTTNNQLQDFADIQ